MDRLNRRAFLLGASALAATRAIPAVAAGGDRWSAQQAADWYRQQPWLVGSNYIPATAINQLEMWQAETFDPGRIDLELGWAQGLGHEHDAGVPARPALAAGRGRVRAARRHLPRHRATATTSGRSWSSSTRAGTRSRSSGRSTRRSRASTTRAGCRAPGPRRCGTRRSTRACATTCRAWSAPSAATSACSAGTCGTSPTTRTTRATGRWSRPTRSSSSRPSCRRPSPGPAPPARASRSPAASGGATGRRRKGAVTQIQLEQSDVISFHNYDWPEEFERRVEVLERYGRPILCTEYMARGAGSTFDGILPIAKQLPGRGDQLGPAAVEVALTPTGDERCRVPTPPTCASGRSRPTRPARAASPRSRGPTGSASARSRAGSSSPARRGAAPQAAPRWPGTPRR